MCVSHVEDFVVRSVVSSRDDVETASGGETRHQRELYNYNFSSHSPASCTWCWSCARPRVREIYAAETPRAARHRGARARGPDSITVYAFYILTLLSHTGYNITLKQALGQHA